MAVREDELRLQLDAVRRELDSVDQTLIQLLARRLALGLDAAGLKRALGMPIHDAEREARVQANGREWARDTGLDEDEVSEILKRLTALSRGKQEKSSKAG